MNEQKVTLELNRIRNTYVNAVNVNGRREEIDIRLPTLLDCHMKEHEDRYGPLGQPAGGTPESIELGIDLLPSKFRTQRTEQEAGLILGLIKNLDLEVGFERSIKLLPDVVLANRFLTVFRRDIGEVGMDKKILELCHGIDMPPDFLKAFKEYLTGANHVSFGFEEHEENCVYKAYLEFGNRYKKIFQKTPEQPNPFIIYTGYKWDTKDNRRNAITQYKCFPAIPVEAIMERLSNSFYYGGKGDLLEITSGILDRTLKKIEPYEILYLEVEEEGNPRKSFDINIYRAKLTMEALYPLLLKIYEYFAIPSEIFYDIYSTIKDQIFGHLSWGIDREGRDFFTFYFGFKFTARITKK